MPIRDLATITITPGANGAHRTVATFCTQQTDENGTPISSSVALETPIDLDTLPTADRQVVGAVLREVVTGMSMAARLPAPVAPAIEPAPPADAAPPAPGWLDPATPAT